MMIPDAMSPAPPRAANAALTLLTLAAFAAWIYPPMLDWVGLGALARWMSASALHRIALMPVLLLLTLLAQGSQTRARRAARRESLRPFADAVGGRLVEVPDSLDHGFRHGGPAIEAQTPNGRITHETVREGNRAWTRARATVPAVDGLGFQLVGPQAGRRLLSLLAPLQGMAVSMAAARASDPMARQAIAALSFLGGPEVPTGQPDLDVMVSLRTNHPEEARRLLAAPGLCSALHRLAACARGWVWSLVPDGAGGALMEIRFAGIETDGDRLRAAHDLARETLGYFAAAPTRVAG